MSQKDVQEKILTTIAELLTDICDETNGEDHNDSKILFNCLGRIIQPFLSKKVPNVTIQNYLMRLLKYTKMENSTLVLILVYIDRVCDLNKMQLNYYNIHKYILLFNYMSYIIFTHKR